MMLHCDLFSCESFFSLERSIQSIELSSCKISHSFPPVRICPRLVLFLNSLCLIAKCQKEFLFSRPWRLEYNASVSVLVSLLASLSKTWGTRHQASYYPFNRFFLYLKDFICVYLRYFLFFLFFIFMVCAWQLFFVPCCKVHHTTFWVRDWLCQSMWFARHFVDKSWLFLFGKLCHHINCEVFFCKDNTPLILARYLSIEKARFEFLRYQGGRTFLIHRCPVHPK